MRLLRSAHGLLFLIGVSAALGFVAVKPGTAPTAPARVTSITETGVIDDGGSTRTGSIDAPEAEGNDPLAPAGGDPGRQATVSGRGATAAKAGIECARGRNGGATDIGVTGERIKLASTVVQSGVGRSFLGSSPTAMKAVVAKVNKDGGVCGRILDLKLVDDGWDANRGLGFIRNFINQDKVFAMPVVPSSEGLTAAIESGDIDKAGIPVVGTDGMLRQQYQSPWVWPVATATESTMRIMAKYAYETKGVRRFGLVYDNLYRFGKEGADAFKRYVATLPGAELKAFVGLQPGQPNYAQEIQVFNSGCNRECEFVGMLLEPTTADTWVAGGPQSGTKITSGAQTLFNKAFADSCAGNCTGMFVWSGYNPAVPPLDGLPDIATFAQDVRTLDPQIDVTNQFLEGAYLGMTVFVEALKKVGPELTRAKLKAVLDSFEFTNQMISTLTWRPGQHYANKTAHAFSMVVSQGSFNGFRDEQTGFVKDPNL